MNLAVYNITLDIHKSGSQVFLPMRKGDTSRQIVATLCENGRPYRLTEGCSAVFTAFKPDGKYIYNVCVVDVENNVIIYPVTLQTTASEGMVNCQFQLIGNNGEVLATPEFGITVDNLVYNGEAIVESSEEFAALTRLYAETNALKEEIETKLANGEFKGEKGDKGDRGEPGVFVGSGDMPEDCNVQVDPDEDPIDIDAVVAEAMSDFVTPEGTIKSSAADFAEVGEWLDGNPNNEDRRGYFVCIDNNVPGAHIRIAKSTDDIRGAIMGIPGFAGNCTKDKFDENGNLLPQYDYVGVMGLIPVIDNGTCTINGRCMPSDNGTAIPSSNNLGYHVVDRIDENRILVVIEPGADMIQRVKSRVLALETDMGDVDAALDGIIALENAYIGGDGE